ncbi:piggybac transposable element-derived protein 4 [Holotrichia oblita]|uniref:Piggybac transposable element-derived protein 4 n=1 Tax=Holotrichia oblita TaxID=644536 RepID=A0ACB9TSH3_HOLOL|nr:piggybac transposable element-derived protein 4 [Holotrichia oblita]
MPRDRFFKLRANMKVVDDNSVAENEKENKFWKIQSLLNKIRTACLTYPRPSFVSIDEQMIPFHGHVSMKQYIRRKPSPWGLKSFVMTTPNGIPLDFIMYAGKNSDFSSALEAPPKMDIGGRVVLKLAESLLNSSSSIIMDRDFTSIPLLQILLIYNIKTTGTLMKSRHPRPISFISDGIEKSWTGQS